MPVLVGVGVEKQFREILLLGKAGLLETWSNQHLDENETDVMKKMEWMPGRRRKTVYIRANCEIDDGEINRLINEGKRGDREIRNVLHWFDLK